MGLILVHHDTRSPALYGAVAAAVAARRNCGFMHIAARFDTSRHADAEQHVVASGGLGPSGLCWYERLSGQAVSPVATIEELLSAARLGTVVVPIHPAFLADADDDFGAVPGIRDLADAERLPVETIHVVDHADRFVDGATGTVLAWRDRYGRIVLDEPSPSAGTTLKVALIGARGDHMGVYPAALACLADAADSLSVALDVDFVDPLGFREADARETLRTYAGILLPGGADMKNVAGQTAVAAFALESQLPIVGLCLGMQTMATAVAWKAFGRRNANLAEADPDAGIKTFVAMRANAGRTHLAARAPQRCPGERGNPWNTACRYHCRRDRHPVQSPFQAQSGSRHRS